jgi:hypothetical protein
MNQFGIDLNKVENTKFVNMKMILARFVANILTNNGYEFSTTNEKKSKV